MAKQSEEQKMRLWFRKPVTLDGTSYAANSFGVVSCSDEAWDCVNRGDADMNPPPGEKLGDFTQPTPDEIPDRLKAGPQTAAALPAVSSVPTGPPVVTMTAKEAEKARQAAMPEEEPPARRGHKK